jgi:hypothetical protein
MGDAKNAVSISEEEAKAKADAAKAAQAGEGSASGEGTEEAGTQPANAAKEDISAAPHPAEPDEKPEEPAPKTAGPAEAEKMIPQSQVNEIVGRTRQETRQKTLEEARAAMREKYGVSTDDELDGLFGHGQQYDALNDQFGDLKSECDALKAENALLKSGISQDRYDDARLILKGKGLDITEENIASELQTHPEWKPAAAEAGGEPSEKPAVIKSLGGSVDSAPSDASDEEENKAFNLFGIGK